VLQIDKLPLVVKSAPGFVVNCVLAPYLVEALNALDEGLDAPQIDAAATDFGKPDELERVRARLQPYIDSGHLGKKLGRGFYTWKDGKPLRPKSTDPSNTAPQHTNADGSSGGGQPQGQQEQQALLAKRLIDPLLDECERVLAENLVDGADRLDAGVIFGTGFAPFRGGPLHYRHLLDGQLHRDQLHDRQSTSTQVPDKSEELS
jgi:3-hydroxyacyl-CoA dehydrogenase/enoyl-CoA hydratase/3-hydroxybutyryl-CoA epimerase